MSAKVFVDTNILLYTRDSSEPEKQIIAKSHHLLSQVKSIISIVSDI